MVGEARQKNAENAAQEEAQRAAKIAASREHEVAIEKWHKNPDGTCKDVRTLLGTLHEVLWENSGWQPVPLSELMTNAAALKKAHRKCILLTHPDKHQNASSEQIYRADRIFNAVNDGFKKL